jgi:hypothetical protein
VVALHVARILHVSDPHAARIFVIVIPSDTGDLFVTTGREKRERGNLCHRRRARAMGLGLLEVSHKAIEFFKRWPS